MDGSQPETPQSSQPTETAQADPAVPKQENSHLVQLQKHTAQKRKAELAKEGINTKDISRAQMVNVVKNTLNEDVLNNALEDNSSKFDEIERNANDLNQAKQEAQELGFSVKYATDAAKIAKAKAELFEEEAKTDGLTGLGNKNAELLYFPQALERILESRKPLAKMKIDVDDLRETNNRYGHPAGNALLKKISEIITEKLAKKAKSFRVGGDEFDVYGENMNQEEALELAEELRLAVSEQVLPAIRDLVPKRKEPFTISIGINGYDPNGHQLEDMGEIYDELDDRADTALYKSKYDMVNGKPKRVKNRVTVYEEGMVRPVDPNQVNDLEVKSPQGIKAKAAAKVTHIANTVLRRNKPAA